MTKIKHLQALTNMRTHLKDGPTTAALYAAHKDTTMYDIKDNTFTNIYGIPMSEAASLTPLCDAITYLLSLEDGYHSYNDRDLTKPNSQTILKALDAYSCYVNTLKNGPQTIQKYVKEQNQMINYYRKLFTEHPDYLTDMPTIIKSSIR